MNLELDKVPLFKGASTSDLATLEQNAKIRKYVAKTQIIWRGEPGDSLFLIQSGTVKVHSSTETGSDITLALLGPGACFGELSVIDHAPRSADITTVEATVCAIIEGDTLRNAVNRSPSLAWHIMRHLTGLVRQNSEAIEALSSRDAAGRVALLLISLAKNHGEQTDSASVRIGVALSKNDIGSFVGATREHVTKIMSEFARAGCIKTDPATGHIVVLDSSKLANRIQ